VTRNGAEQHRTARTLRFATLRLRRKSNAPPVWGRTTWLTALGRCSAMRRLPFIRRVGHGREDIKPFFEALGPERCQRLKAAVMDMNASSHLEVRRHCQKAAIVFDLFHVVAKYGREVIDRVRVDRANELRTDRADRRVIKGARWLLLKNRDSLNPGEDVELEELLAANRSLFVVYVMRDALKDLWNLRAQTAAAQAWRSGYRRHCAVASNRSDASPGARAPMPPASSPTAAIRSAPTLSKASTTRSRSSNAWPAASEMMPTSSLKIRTAFPGGWVKNLFYSAFAGFTLSLLRKATALTTPAPRRPDPPYAASPADARPDGCTPAPCDRGRHRCRVRRSRDRARVPRHRRYAAAKR
jgi:hypothetical protein